MDEATSLQANRQHQLDQDDQKWDVEEQFGQHAKQLYLKFNKHQQIQTKFWESLMELNSDHLNQMLCCTAEAANCKPNDIYIIIE